MPRLRDPLPGRAMVPGLLTTLPTPGRWWYLPLLRGDDHRRRAHRRHRREPTLARSQHTRPSLKKPPRFEGKLNGRIDVAVAGGELGDVGWHPVHDRVGDEQPTKVVEGVTQWAARGIDDPDRGQCLVEVLA